MNQDRKRLIQRLAQGFLALAFLAAGLANVVGAMTPSLVELGFPEYMRWILAGSYLIAVACLYQPWVKFLQEWAYAGFACALVGAIAAHVFVGDPIFLSVPAVVLGIALIVAYRLRINP